jgi:hypothetical protein
MTAGTLPRMPRELGLPEARDAGTMARLSPEARKELERDADVNLDTVADHYSAACVRVQQALHERARSKKGHWFLELLVDVIAGTLLPGLANGALARAVDALTAGARWEETIELGLLVLENKQIHALVNGVVKEVNGRMKGAFKTIARDRSATEQFVQGLGDAARNQIAQLRKQLDNLDDSQLMAVYLAYDPVANDSTFLADRIADVALKFEAQVEPIGDREVDAGNMAYAHARTKTLAYVGGKLALVTRFSSTLRATGEEQAGARYRLEQWISDEMTRLALDSANGPIPHLEERDVWAEGTPDQPSARVR